MNKEQIEFLSYVQTTLESATADLRELEVLADESNGILDSGAAEKLLASHAKVLEARTLLQQCHEFSVDEDTFNLIREDKHIDGAYFRVLRRLLTGKPLCGNPGKCEAEHSTLRTMDLTPREEANAITGLAFRNGFLEDLHSGKDSKLLERPELSRITDPEMKKLMIESSAVLAGILAKRDHDPAAYWKLIEYGHTAYTKDWDKGQSAETGQGEDVEKGPSRKVYPALRTGADDEC